MSPIAQSLRAHAVFACIAALVCAVLSVTGDAAHAAEEASDPSVIDRTYACSATVVGGLLGVELRAHAGTRRGTTWQRLPYVVVASGNDARRPFEDAPPASSLAWITAGSPSPSTTVDDTWLSFTPRVGGTVGVNRQACTPTRTRIPLSGSGLIRVSVSPRISGVVCGVPRRVLVRIRAVVDGGTALRERSGGFRATGAPARLAKLALGTPAGRVVVFADTSDTGQARVFSARGCTSS